jgi:hypothetical protein
MNMSKKKVLSFFMVLLISCSILLIPSAQCKAACAHNNLYDVYRGPYQRITDTHIVVNELTGSPSTCYINYEIAIVSIYCSDCGAYLGDDLYYSTPTHSHPACNNPNG